MLRLNKANVVMLTGFVSIVILSATAFLISPTGASAAWNCRTACTAANRGITSFFCPGTPTESVCGTAPNFTCYEGANDPCPDNYKMFCEQAGCPVACDTSIYPCTGCSAATSNINDTCSNPANGQYTDRCSTCACPTGTVQCTSPNKCVTPISCAAGYIFDACQEACIAPNILTSPGSPQTATINVTGDITTTGGNYISSVGDFYLSSGKAIRVDAASNTILNVGNGNTSWGYYDVNLNVLGSITATKSFGIGSVFSVNNLGQLTATTAVSGANAIVGINSNATNGTGVYGSGVYGVYGNGAYGVIGYGTSAGVFASTTSAPAIYGQTSTGYAGYFYATNTGAGSYAYSASGNGAFGDSNSGTGVYGRSAWGYGGYFTASNNNTALYATSASGYAAIFQNGNVGIGTTTPGYKLDVANSTQSRTVNISNNYGTGVTYGLYAANSSTNSTSAAVGGVASGVSGNVWGVYGSSASTGSAAAGVYGISPNYGVYGQTSGSSGLAAGVYGDSGTGYGVKGVSFVASKAGVYGMGGGNGILGYGVMGQVDATSAAGAAGVYGYTVSNNGGYAVYGNAAGGLNTNYGGYFTATSGVGAYGSGSTYGVQGTSASGSGYGGHFTNSGSGVGLYASSASGYALITNVGNVGIGTASPGTKLDVNGTVKMTGLQLGSSATAGYVLTANASGVGSWAAPAMGGSGTLNYIPKFTPSGTILGNSMIYDNGTNVGIGTTAPSSSVKVHIANGNLGLDGGYGIYSKESGGTMIAIMAMDGSTNQTTIRGYGGGWRVAGKTGLQLMYIDDAGQTIIGSGSPTAKLDVAGTAKMTGFQLTTGAASGYVLKSDASGVGTWQSSGISGTANYLAKFTGTGVTVGNSQIQDNGTNVGIKGAPDATYELRVTTGIYSAWLGSASSWFKFNASGNAALSFSDGTSGSSAGFIMGTHNASSQNALQISGCTDAGSCPVYTTFLENGRVGIGTATPGTSLEVNGTAKMTGFQLGSSATAGYVLTANASGVGSWAAPAMSGSGTTYAIPMFTGATTLGNSLIHQDYTGTYVGIGGDTTANPLWGELDIFRSGSYARLYLSSSQSSAGNIPGVLTFAAKNSAGNKKDYSGISGYISDATSASEDGDIRFHTVLNGTWNVRAWLTSDGRFALGGYNPTAEMLYVPGNVQIGANDATAKMLAFGYAPTTGRTQVGSSKPADIRWDPASGSVAFYTDSTLRLVGATAAPTVKMTLSTDGDLSFAKANPYISASSYFIAPGGAYFNSGTVYTEAAIQVRGGINNDTATNFGGDVAVTDNFRINGVLTCLQGYCPSNSVARLTPNLHLNSLGGYAVILNWDNGTTGSSQTFRIGNGASSDVFWVRANGETYVAGNVGIGTTTMQNKVNIYGNNYALRLQGSSSLYGERLNFGDGQYVYFEEPSDDVLHIYSAGYKYFDGGNLGVGTASPRQSFHVLGRAAVGWDWNTGGALTFYPSDGYAWFHIDNGWNNPSPGRGQGYLRFSMGNNPGDTTIMKLWQSGAMEMFYAAYKPGGGAWAASSDRRVKKDVSPFVSGLDTIKQLRPINYTYNGLAETVEGFKGIGFIAQDVKDVAPYMITTRQMKLHPEDTEPTDIYYLDPSALPFLNMNSIKELAAEMDKKLSLDERGSATIPGDLSSENNVWGSDSGWLDCPADGSECACPDGSYVSSIKDQGRTIRCHKL